MIHKFLILSMLFCNFMMLSSSSIFSMWIWMEFLSLIMLTFLLMNSFFNKNIMIIFIMQSLSLIMFIMTSLPIISFKSTFFSKIMMLMFIISMSIKIGFFPFIYWYNYIIMNLSWNNIFIYTTIFKFIPMYMLSSLFSFYMMILILIPSSLFSSLLMNKSFIFKEIISMSSIFNSSWISLTLIMNKYLGILCFLLYLINMWIICLMINNSNNSIKFNFKKLSKSSSIILFMSLISMMGLPPFSGLIMKMFMMITLTKLMLFFLSFTLMFSSLLNMYSYFKFLNFLIFSSSMKINFNYNNLPTNISFPLILNLSLFIFLMFI